MGGETAVGVWAVMSLSVASCQPPTVVVRHLEAHSRAVTPSEDVRETPRADLLFIVAL
jgi:hypothetical protein